MYDAFEVTFIHQRVATLINWLYVT